MLLMGEVVVVLFREGGDDLLGDGGVVVLLGEGGDDLLGQGGVVDLLREGGNDMIGVVHPHLPPRLPQKPANSFLQLRPLLPHYLLFQLSQRRDFCFLVV